MPNEVKFPYEEYKEYAQTYLDRDIFSDTPMTGKMLADAAKNTYERTGHFISPAWALAQGQLESSLGLHAREPVVNPYNVGEFDSGEQTVVYNTIEEGIQGYYDLLADDYLSAHTKEELLENFVNMNNDRYASDSEYETKMVNQIRYIDKYVRAKGLSKSKEK